MLADRRSAIEGAGMPIREGMKLEWYSGAGAQFLFDVLKMKGRSFDE